MMQTVSKSALESWAVERSLRIEGQEVFSLDSKDAAELRVRLPLESHSLLYIAADIVTWVANDLGAMLWISDWALYTAEQMSLIAALRTTLGSETSLIEAPGILWKQEGQVAKSESELLSGFIFLVLSFEWDCYLFSMDGRKYVQVQDGFIYFSTRQSTESLQSQIIVEKYGLRVQ